MKSTIFSLFLFAAIAAQGQKEAITMLKPQPGMPSPVTHKPMDLSAKLTKRIWFYVEGQRHFWDCQEIVEEEDRYIAITRYKNGTVFERIVYKTQFDYISNLR